MALSALCDLAVLLVAREHCTAYKVLKKNNFRGTCLPSERQWLYSSQGYAMIWQGKKPMGFLVFGKGKKESKNRPGVAFQLPKFSGF